MLVPLESFAPFAGIAFLGFFALYCLYQAVRGGSWRASLRRLGLTCMIVLSVLAFRGARLAGAKVGGTNEPNRAGVALRVPARASTAEPDDDTAGDDAPVDAPRVEAIAVTDAGVDLVLHRPAAGSAIAAAVTVAGSCSYAPGGWEALLDAAFPAGDAEVAVAVPAATLAQHGISDLGFFAFAAAGDSDGDGLADWFELLNSRTRADARDTDGDGMPDGWEWRHALAPNDPRDAWLDADEDGVLNHEEWAAGTLPRNRDTDGDGLTDREELGWWEIRGAYADLAQNEGTVYVCPPPAGGVVQGVYAFDLPFVARLCGRNCTRGFADVHGVVHFLPDGADAPDALGVAGSVDDAVPADGVSVAAYRGALRLRGGVSSIRLTVRGGDGVRVAVVEYHAVGIGSDASDRLTFRIAVAEDRPDEVVVQYVSLQDPDEGQGASFGVLGPGARPRLVVSSHAPTPVAEGLTFVYHLGPGSDPCLSDTDGDGLPDGWEVRGGLAPNSAQGGDGVSGDPDGDGLSNWAEYVLGALPLNPFTFSPDWNDSVWTSNGYAAPAPDAVPVVVRVGDPSRSRSECWSLHLDDDREGGRRYVVPCSAGGETAATTLYLERGRHYTGRLEHLGSTAAEPDYDWTAQVDGWPSTYVLPAGQSHAAADRFREDAAKGYLLDNGDGLLGRCEEAFGSYDNTVGKRFFLATARTQIAQARICLPCDVQPRAVFSLTDDSSAVADWTIEPVVPDGPRLFSTLVGGEGASTLAGVPRVYVSAGSVPGRYTLTARHPAYEAVRSSAAFDACRFKVEAVRFNHNEWSADNDAVNLRASYDVKGFDHETGEWANDGAVNFPVCYKAGVTPRIQARFSVQPAVTLSARFFAQQSDPDGAVGGVLDDEVLFADGVSGWKEFAGVRPVPTVVSRGNIAFDWYLCGLDGRALVPVEVGWTGPHLVYTILDDPIEPWITDPTNAKCGAWTNALDWACTRAFGATTRHEAASRITEEIYESGCFMYGGARGDEYGNYWYDEDELPFFECQVWDISKAIDRLNGSFGRDAFVTCFDCAAFVTAFSNLMGCRLYASQMHDDFMLHPEKLNFMTNVILPIGSDWQAFSWLCHVVAWDGECGDVDVIYDACLKFVDRDVPRTDEEVPSLHPVGMRFSDGDEAAPFVYRERLACPGMEGYDRCLSWPITRIRRELR